MVRAAYIAAGVFLVSNAVYVAFRLVAAGNYLVLVLVACPLLAALALGSLLVAKNVKPQPPSPEQE